MRRYKITRKTKPVQRESDSYNSYNIVTCILTSVSGFLFISHDGVLVLQLLVVIAILCAIMLIIKYQLALASVKISSQID